MQVEFAFDSEFALAQFFQRVRLYAAAGKVQYRRAITLYRVDGEALWRVARKTGMPDVDRFLFRSTPVAIIRFNRCYALHRIAEQLLLVVAVFVIWHTLCRLVVST